MSVSIVPTLKVLLPAARIALVALIGLIGGYYANAMFFPGTSPEQPIDFSHRVHAGENEIPCMYCHVQADALFRRACQASINVWDAIQRLRPTVRKYVCSQAIGETRNRFPGSRCTTCRISCISRTSATCRQISNVRPATGRLKQWMW